MLQEFVAAIAIGHNTGVSIKGVSMRITYRHLTAFTLACALAIGALAPVRAAADDGEASSQTTPYEDIATADAEEVADVSEQPRTAVPAEDDSTAPDPDTTPDPDAPHVMRNPELSPQEPLDEISLSTQSVPSEEVELLAQSVSSLGYEPHLNYIWASDLANTIYFVVADYENYDCSYKVYRLDVEAGKVTEVYTTDGDDFYYAHDTFYVRERWTDTLHRVDLATGSEETIELEGIGSIQQLGVDDAGRLYVQYEETINDRSIESIAVFDSRGTMLASASDVPSNSGFLGFDTTTGNFYFEGSYNWRYWGYDHDMASLKMGNFDAGSGTITVSDEAITIFYQRYFYEHYGCAELLGGRYLADLSTFQGDVLGIFDSRAINLDDITEMTTEISLINGDVTVPLAALPESTLLLGVKTFDSDYDEDGGFDASSVGTRAAYLEEGGIVAVATQPQQATLYRLSDKAKLGFVQTSQPIYKILSSGNNLYFIEKASDGSFVAEHVDLTFPTTIDLRGPSQVIAGDSPDYEIDLNGSVQTVVHMTSSDPSILSIEDTGAAAAWKVGTVTITAKTDDGLEAQLPVTVSTRTTPATGAGVVKTKGVAIPNWQEQDYGTYGSVVKSHLVETDDGLMRVQSDESRVLIERYDALGRVTSSKSIANSLPLFGGFFHDKDGSNYLVFGKQNPKESESLVVVRVIRYDESWNERGRCDIKGINTCVPFSSGSLRMDSAGGKLYIHTCHTMYQSEDGYNHQANMTFVVDEASMRLVDSYSGVMNLSEGYVSHSFNQFVRAEDDYLYRVDHGDAYPRGIAFTKTSLSKSLSEPELYDTVATFADESYGNYTGSTVGGLELSDTHALIVWNEDAQDDDSIRNVFVTAVDKMEGTATTTALTSYKSKTGCLTPQLVKIDNRHFLVLWSEYTSKTKSYTLGMANIDQAGRRVGPVVRKNLPASDCQPIMCRDGMVRWFVSSDWDTRIYAIDPFNLASTPQDTLNDEIMSREDIWYAYVYLADQAWTGKAIRPNPKVYWDDAILKRGTDYTLSFANNINIGTATVTIKGIGSFRGTQTVTFKIVKAPNPMKVKTVKRAVWQSSVQKKAVTVKPPLKFVKKAQGTVTYTKTSGPKNFVVNKKTGKVTIKKGTKRGTYTIKIKVRAAGTKTYKATTKTIKATIVVK